MSNLFVALQEKNKIKNSVSYGIVAIVKIHTRAMLTAPQREPATPVPRTRKVV